MSCQLGTIAHIQDFSYIKRHLFPEQSQEEKKIDLQTDGWGDTEWGWEVEDEKTDSDSSVSKLSTSWLQGTLLSISPTGDLMVFASKDRIVYLAQKWDARNEDVQTKYSVVHEGNPIHQPGETITSVLCLPLASQKRSLEGSPDWTCVIIGFSSGYVRIYTENGTLLISQMFSEESVVRVRCMTYVAPRHGREGERAEEVCILFPRSVVLIDGFSFYQTLKACKNQAARAAATGNDIIDSPLLACKKWSFTDQEKSMDMVPCGYIQPTIFDQMLSDCISKGPNSGIRTNLYSSHLYLTVGKAPCINFFHTVQTTVQPQLSDVANVVASKLKVALLSAASGWLGVSGGGNDSKEKKKPKMEPDVPLSARFGLYDKRRVGEQVALSPDYKMAATTDSFGRVILMDVLRGVAVRMWKGYRDAQVGWIESVETKIQDGKGETKKRFRSDEGDKIRTGESRRTCFLVIYAPRRGILEVWSAQSGPRVAAFGVPKTGRLVYPGHGMLGLNGVIASHCDVVRNRFDGLFFVDVDGSVKNLSVPFHLVFSGKNSRRTRDAHLLKQLLVLLKENKTDAASLRMEVISLLKDIRTCFSQRQFLEKVMSTKYMTSSSLKEIVNSAVKFASRSNEGHGPEVKNLMRWCHFKLSLLDFYDNIAGLPGKAKRYGSSCRDNASSEDTKESITEVLVGQLKLEDHEASILAEVLFRRLAINKMTSSSAPNRKSVKFEEEVMTPEEFLSCFEFKRNTSERQHEDGLKDPEGTEPMIVDDDERDAEEKRERQNCDDDDDDDDFMVSLSKNLHESKLNNLGEFLFEVVTSQDEMGVERLKSHLSNCPLCPEDLLNLLVAYILSQTSLSLRIVPSLLDLENVLIESFANKKPNDSLSGFLLENYARRCSQSENILPALILALIGRCLSYQKQALEGSMELNPGWEEVTVNKERWSQMSRQLQDLLTLENLFKIQDFKSVSRQTCSKVVDISLQKVAQEGRGAIPEAIGKFMSGLGVPVRVFRAPSDPPAPDDPIPPSKPRGRTPSVLSKSCGLDEIALAEISVGLVDIKKHLPLTASDDVVLANCCWEFVANWNRDPEVTEPLDLALEYLEEVKDFTLQFGATKMIWEMFVVKRLSSAVLLAEKVGKAPKDRLIRKDVGLSEKAIVKFIAFALALLDILLHEKAPPTIVHDESTNQDHLLYDVEDAWMDYSSGRSSSLLELAVNQATVESLLVLHHRSLCIALKALMTFSLKSVKIFSLFDSRGRNSFFKPLHQIIVTSIDVADESVKAARLSFLERLILHSTNLLGDAGALNFEYDSQVVAMDTGYSEWHRLVTDLAQLFVIDPDFAIVRFAYHLFLNGFDGMAIEVLLPVSDRNEAGKFLMPVLGARLVSIVFCSDAKLQARRTCISSTCLTSWLRTVDTTILNCKNVPRAWTHALAKLLTKLLDEDHPHFSLAKEAFDIIPNFENP